MEDVTWGDFLRASSATIGITAFFALIASGFLLWTESLKGPLGHQRVLVVLVAGQITAAVVAIGTFGYWKLSKFLAPGVGAVCGLIGYPVIKRIADRGPDIADRVIDKIGHHQEEERR